MSALPAGLCDYHLHSDFSDGHAGLDEMARRALDQGINEIGFSDHLVPGRLDFKGYGIDRGRLDEYVAAVDAARRRFPGLRILLGVEVDYTADTAGEMAAVLDALPLDYVICSVHFVDDFLFDLTSHRDDERWRDTDGIYRRYWELIGEAAAWGHGDIAGHLELPKKFGRRPAGDVAAAQDAALDAIAAAGLAIELNTAGLDMPAAEVYPSPAILDAARARDIPLVLGSDAHWPEQVGRHFGAAVSLARASGHESLLRLSDRAQVPLP